MSEPIPFALDPADWYWLVETAERHHGGDIGAAVSALVAAARR